MSEKPKLHIDWASHQSAKYACENWHYSKSIPAGKLVKVGVWENDKFIGVVIFGRGANNNLLKPYGLNQDEGCELVRIALTKHITPVSKIMSIAIKWLRQANPRLRLIVSYADIDQNHHGGIYQATNWVYVGAIDVNLKRGFVIHGKRVHPRSIHSLGVKQNIDEIRKHIDPNAQLITIKGKHKYLFPLDKAMAKQIDPLKKPYPKRVKEQPLSTP